MYLSYFYFGDDKTLIDTNTMFSMTQANQNFSAVARSVDKNGEAVAYGSADNEDVLKWIKEHRLS